jgi:hypothetical protein
LTIPGICDIIDSLNEQKKTKERPAGRQRSLAVLSSFIKGCDILDKV